MARAGLVLGAVLGLVPLGFADPEAIASESVWFGAVIFGFALLPYLVFARAERRWSRPLAVVVLALLGALHVAATVMIASALDEDALSGIAFLTIPPLLALGVAAVAGCGWVAQALARRRG